MPILLHQLKDLNERILLEALARGRIPSLSEVGMKLDAFLRQADGGPLMRPRFQGKKHVWDVKSTNLVLREIHDDLRIAYAEVIEQLGLLLSRLSFVHLSAESQRQQVKKLISLLDNLQLAAKNTDDSFFGAFDSFSDLSKTNVELSTRDVVDLDEGCLSLPYNAPSAYRVDMAHLYSQRQWPISASVVANEVPFVGPTSRIVQNETIDGNWFSHAWSDMLNAWRHIVTSDSELGCSIEFTVPVSALGDEEVSITRIGLRSAASQPMTVTILKSVDNVNFTRFPDILEKVDVQPGDLVNLDFGETRVQYLRFKLFLSSPTQSAVSDTERSFSYVFGIRGIALYRYGRARQAEWISKPLSATAMDSPIDKAALEVVEDLPPGCDIDWFVAPDDGAGAPEGGIWIPVNPINRAKRDGLSSVVRFAEASMASVGIVADDPVVYDTVRNVNFYDLMAEPLANEPLRQDARLYRGIGGWWVNAEKEIVVRYATDMFVDFNPSDVQRIYALRTDSPASYIGGSTQTDGWVAGLPEHTVLVVESPVHYVPESMMMVPPSTPGLSVDPDADTQPRYAVYKVERTRDIMQVSNESITLNGFAFSSLENFGLDPYSRPVVTNSDGSVIYLEGRDYEVEATPSGLLTGKIRRSRGLPFSSSSLSRITDGQTVKVSYSLAINITSLVALVRDNEVHLSVNMGTIADQRFRVTYRFSPILTHGTIERASVVVSSGIGSGATVYTEGTDYVVDSVSGTITRIPTGRIQDRMVYMDFRYRTQPKDVAAYSTWVYVGEKTPVVIEFTALNLAVADGEGFAIDGVNLTNQTSTQELEFGWHLVEVRSKDPGDSRAAIVQIAGLRDRDGKPVFLRGGRYFSKMQATRDPMVQVPYLQLTKATPRLVHDSFAIDGGRVIVNFDPENSDDVWTYGYRIVDNELVYGYWPEEFQLDYSYQLDESDPVEAVLVRALLRRRDAASGGVTPKAFQVNLRLA